jgi:hypothetical protein
LAAPPKLKKFVADRRVHLACSNYMNKMRQHFNILVVGGSIPLGSTRLRSSSYAWQARPSRSMGFSTQTPFI